MQANETDFLKKRSGSGIQARETAFKARKAPRFAQFLEQPFSDGAPVDLAFVALTEARGQGRVLQRLINLQPDKVEADIPSFRKLRPAEGFCSARPALRCGASSKNSWRPVPTRFQTYGFGLGL